MIIMMMINTDRGIDIEINNIQKFLNGINRCEAQN